MMMMTLLKDYTSIDDGDKSQSIQNYFLRMIMLKDESNHVNQSKRFSYWNLRNSMFQLKLWSFLTTSPHHQIVSQSTNVISSFKLIVASADRFIKWTLSLIRYFFLLHHTNHRHLLKPAHLIIRHCFIQDKFLCPLAEVHLHKYGYRNIPPLKKFDFKFLGIGTAFQVCLFLAPDTDRQSQFGYRFVLKLC